MSAERIDRLVDRFNGSIKYTPMLQDHPEWTDEQCLSFAHKWHEVAEKRYRTGDAWWNNGIPYVRNIWKEPK